MTDFVCLRPGKGQINLALVRIFDKWTFFQNPRLVFLIISKLTFFQNPRCPSGEESNNALHAQNLSTQLTGYLVFAFVFVFVFVFVFLFVIIRICLPYWQGNFVFVFVFVFVMIRICLSYWQGTLNLYLCLYFCL